MKFTRKIKSETIHAFYILSLNLFCIVSAKSSHCYIKHFQTDYYKIKNYLKNVPTELKVLNNLQIKNNNFKKLY